MAKGPTKKDLAALVKRLEARVVELEAHNVTLTEQLEASGERAVEAVRSALTGGRRIGPTVTVRPTPPRKPPKPPKKPNFGPRITRSDGKKAGDLAPSEGYADEGG